MNPRCPFYVAAGTIDADGLVEFPWPVAANRCVHDAGHGGDHLPERDA